MTDTMPLTVGSLSTVEKELLQFMGRRQEWCFGFKALVDAFDNAPPRDVMIAATRLLKARGLVKCSRGLMTEEGDGATHSQHFAMKAYEIADAMMEARK